MKIATTAPVVCFATLLTVNTALAFDAATEFGGTNPAGPWSYGYTETIEGAFTAFDLYDTAHLSPGYLTWRATDRDQYLLIGLDNEGGLFAHPGPGTEHAVLRFTAPTSSSYSVSVQFIDLHSGDTSGHVLLNGNTLSPLAHFASVSGTQSFSTSVSLVGGDIIDVVVGNKDGYFDDTNYLSVQITAIPEPGSAALLAGAWALGLAFLPRRRRR